MTTEQTAQQLELAAQILRANHPWGYRRIAGSRYKYNTPIEVVADGNFLSPLLATPPDNRPLHNPDNLTAEQVGVGYRLLLPVELDGRHKKACEVWNGKNDWSGEHLALARYKSLSYRLPISVPWPEPEKPDPYAELKAAHAAGKGIQGLIGGHWINSPHPTWKYPVDTYRVKPDEPVVCAVVKPEPAFQLPPAPPGMRWHREDGWTADDLPQGYRPMCVGEKVVSTQDEVFEFDEWTSRQVHGFPVDEHPRHRTTRPLLFEHAGKRWQWHRAGDPMPCESGKRLEIIYESGEDDSRPEFTIDDRLDDSCVNWKANTSVIGWRYAEPQTKTVPLSPEDVPPGSVFRSKDQPKTTFWTVSQVWEDGFYLRGDSMPWDTARERMQINRSIPLTGKWNPDAWEPCSKPIPA